MSTSGHTVATVAPVQARYVLLLRGTLTMNALRPVLKSLLAGLLTVPAFGTRADVITDWSIRTGG